MRRVKGWIRGPVISCHGVTVGFRASWPGVLAEINSIFVPGSRATECAEPDVACSLEHDESRGVYAASIGSRQRIQAPDLKGLLESLRSRLEHTIAEAAVEPLFVHAGAVGWRGKAILFPGRSGSGKSMLVRELICAGATYFSDEFAVIDTNGSVHSFARPLSIRTINGKVGCSPGLFRAQTATEPLPVGMVVFAEYQPRAEFRPVILTPGRALLDFLKHVVIVRANPGKAIYLARLVTSDCPVLSSVRGEARSLASLLLSSLERPPAVASQNGERRLPCTR